MRDTRSAGLPPNGFWYRDGLTTIRCKLCRRDRYAPHADDCGVRLLTAYFDAHGADPHTPCDCPLCRATIHALFQPDPSHS